MNQDSIFWHNGMVLTPQHMDYMSQKYKALTQFYYQVSNPYGYGIYQLKIDKEELLKAEIKITQCIAIFQNQTCIHIDSDQPLVLPLKNKHCVTLIYLTLDNQHNEKIEKNNITLHRPKVFLTEEQIENSHQLAILQIKSSATQAFHELVESYFGPTLDIKHVLWVKNNLMEILNLSDQIAIISTRIRHLIHQNPLHPYQLYQGLNDCLSDLQAPSYQIPYQHENAYSLIKQLLHQLIETLKSQFSYKTSIPSFIHDNTLQFSLTVEQILQHQYFIVTNNSDIQQAQIKLSQSHRIEKIYQHSLSGFDLSTQQQGYLIHFPESILKESMTHHFSIKLIGEHCLDSLSIMEYQKC